MLEFNALPAREGDAIWIRWGDPAEPHQMLVDLGTESTGRQIRARLESLPDNHRRFDLVIVTHVDRDHIGGVLTCFVDAEPLPGLEIRDIWFNGLVHLQGGSIVPSPAAQPAGAVQGERLTRWLQTQRWNMAFAGAPVQRVPGRALQSVELHDELRLTVLGPTPERLQAFIGRWQDEVREAIESGSLEPEALTPGVDVAGAEAPPVLDHEQDLLTLATSHSGTDHSDANGSSIAVLLEYKGTTMLLSGDAYSADMVGGIQQLQQDADELLHLDLFKLPHHGSRNNVHRALIEQVTCDRWLISTDGTRFRHPDAEAIARIIAFGNPEQPLIAFNVPSTFNRWWDNQEWQSKFGYAVEYGDDSDGLQLQFPGEI